MSFPLTRIPLLVTSTRSPATAAIGFERGGLDGNARSSSTGIPVGISAESQYAPTTFQFEIDDVLIAYTDGITEVENRQHELWGQQRLEALLKSCSRKTAKEIINAILEQVSAFANGQSQRDDITLLVMRVEAGCDD
jgi:serine phosphatase RsbU (regulator of sigma subunit)